MAREQINRKRGRLLAEVLNAIVDRLVADDWGEFRDEKANRHFFVVGLEAFWLYVEDPTVFNSLHFSGSQRLTPKAEWFVRSQVAGAHPPVYYLPQAQRRLEEAGVPAETIERLERLRGQGIDHFCKGGFEDFFKELRFDGSVSARQRNEALVEFLDAWGIRLSREGLEAVAESSEQELEVGRQKLFLKEVSRKYEKVVDRGSVLDPVTFKDLQLEEASKCYLYCFYRASIALSAEAVETHLKRCTGLVNDSNRDRIEQAKSLGKLNQEGKIAANRVFDVRNEVVHDGLEPRHDEAQEVLLLAKEVINQLCPS